MSRTFTGLDNEFAVSTGSNVNDAPGQSSFDYPPNSTRDLIVTADPSDPTPKLFELGETYDVQYSGPGGTHFLDDATIIRSDDAPGGGGVVVFEGLNGSGELTQVVWTPDFDLETWYFDNFSGGQPPKFYTADQNATYTHQVTCFAKDTQIVTDQGSRPITALREGDRVQTLDAGLQRILWIGHRTVAGHGPGCPVHFAPNSIGNRVPLRLSLQHRVLFRSPMAELLFGHHEVLVPAKALVNDTSIRFAPCASVTYVHILLEDHHLVRVAGGALCETLLPGNMTQEIPPDHLDQIAHVTATAPPYRAARPILTYRECRSVLDAGLTEEPPRLETL